MELGGDLDDFVDNEPFDTFSVMSVRQSLSWSAIGGKDGRVPNYAYAGQLESYAAQARVALADINAADLPPMAAKRLRNCARRL